MSELSTIEAGEQGCANLTGALTFESTPSLYKESENLFKSPAPISSINLSGVTAVDSAGLALLLEWQAAQQTVSNNLRYLNAPSSLMSLARLCDAIELLNMTGRSGEP
jgi:phospholipid transport system transporter-binding protein